MCYAVADLRGPDITTILCADLAPVRNHVIRRGQIESLRVQCLVIHRFEKAVNWLCCRHRRSSWNWVRAMAINPEICG